MKTYSVIIKTKEFDGGLYYLNTLTLRGNSFGEIEQRACEVMEVAFTSAQEARITEIKEI